MVFTVVTILQMVPSGDTHIIANAAVLIDDCITDETALTDSHGRLLVTSTLQLLFRLHIIAADAKSAPRSCALADTRSRTYNRQLDTAGFHDTPFGRYRMIKGRSRYF